MTERDRPTAGGTRRLELRVPGMDCPSCAEKIRGSVEGLDGVEGMEAHVASGTLVTTYDPEVADEGAIRERVGAAGYAVADDGSELVLSVPEMDCCANEIEAALGDVDGVEGVESRPAAGRLIVSGTVDTETVVDAVEAAGYEATPVDGRDRLREPREIWRGRRAAGTAVGAVLVVAGGLLAFVAPGANPELFAVAGRSYAASHVLFVLAAAVAGAPIVRNGYYSARTHSLDIDLLMSVGILASVAAHHPFEGATLAVLFSVAELLERFSMDRARASIRELLDRSPETARIKRADGTEETVSADAVAVGDVVVVRPGERIPVDGVVREGQSAVNQAPITGESVPLDRSEGEEVYAGTIAESGYLEVEATSEADESTLARIVELVESAEREKTDREQFVDRFAGVYTPIVVLAAIVVAVAPPALAGASWNTWFLRGLTLLVIACPCAFVISTPVSVVSGITSAAKHGVLIKGGRYLEAAGESDVVAVDKTGTLTTGELAVTDVYALGGIDEDDLLARASAVEKRSEHPLGEAIVAHATELGVENDHAVAGFEALAGRGVRADLDGERHYVGKPGLFEGLVPALQRTRTDGGEAVADAPARRGGVETALAEAVVDLERAGKTAVLVGTDDRLLGVIGVADRLRPEAAWTVERLEAQGVRVVMLTGDNEGTARAIAEEIGIGEYHAGLLPEEKLAAIRRLEAESSGVVMVGDGINDAPALATATVGVAMGAAGTDTAIETADVALMGDDLSRLPYLHRLSRSANGVIRGNIWSSLAVKAILAAGAPFGVVTVIHAVVIGDMGMSLGVTGNAMRLSRVEPDRPDDRPEAG